ncbi:MAG: type II and III secretion system protein family protein [Hyphomicrobiaceae bacterium]|nr:type II and III secretion system protein family protein [Hyphomicrobiaceae bacterium]
MPALRWPSAASRQRMRRTDSLAAVFAAVFMALSAFGGIHAALAGPDVEDEQHATDPMHRSHMVVPEDGPFPVRQKITIGVDKSMLVELPVDLQNVLVSNPEVLDAVVQTSRQVYLLAKDLGEANAFFIGPSGEKVLFLEVSVTRDLSALQDMLQRLLPGSSVAAEMMGDSVVLSGMVATPADANRAAELAARFVKKKDGVVNLLGTNSKEQVLLKVQVAEMQRDALRRFGIDVADSLLQAGNFTFAKVIRNGFPVTSPSVAEAAIRAVGEAPFVAAGSALAPTWQTGEQSITGLVQALERAGVLKTLAAPTLTAISGEQAKFLAGGEFPIPVAQDDNKVTVDFKPFGINVAFKPVVLDEGRISLSVSAEVSEITTEGGIQLRDINLPGLKVRRAETTLELPSGGTLAMAGLLSDDVRQSIEGVPGLKDLPVLGALFRSQDYRRRETELVILVTPFLAKHAAYGQLAKPTDGFGPASGLQQLFFGHINRVYGISAPAEPGYHGDYGFIIDYPGVKG